jgi:hypothetical protein
VGISNRISQPPDLERFVSQALVSGFLKARPERPGCRDLTKLDAEFPDRVCRKINRRSGMNFSIFVKK